VYCCQICNETFYVWNSNINEMEQYIEVHHIWPLGKGGFDTTNNMLVLCPNHHAEFDLGTIALNPDTLLIEHIDEDNSYNGKKLRNKKHKIDKKNLDFHYEKTYYE